MNIGHFETDMMLAAERVFREEPVYRAVFAKRFDQFNLGAVGRAFRRRIDETDLHALRRQIKRLANRRSAHDITPMGYAVAQYARQ